MSNLITALILAAYLAVVGTNGNSGKLVDELKKEGGFIKWALSLALLLAILDRFPSAIATPAYTILIFSALIVAAERGVLQKAVASIP